MNWFSQLTRLILDFYREDPAELRQLQGLKACRLSRRWGVLRIECRDRQVAETLLAAQNLLKEPIAELRIAHQINILVNGVLISSLVVDPSKISFL
ncbi:MAG: hypothetical protein SNJ57_03045 [Cyanobacteriota bacterium]